MGKKESEVADPINSGSEGGIRDTLRLPVT